MPRIVPPEEAPEVAGKIADLVLMRDLCACSHSDCIQTTRVGIMMLPTEEFPGEWDDGQMALVTLCPQHVATYLDDQPWGDV